MPDTTHIPGWRASHALYNAARIYPLGAGRRFAGKGDHMEPENAVDEMTIEMQRQPGQILPAQAEGLVSHVRQR